MAGVINVGALDQYLGVHPELTRGHGAVPLGLRAGGGRAPGARAIGGALIGAGLGSSLALGTFGATIAEAAPALASLGPYGAAALAALGIADLVFGGAFNGKPKMLDTVQAVARLYQSRDPEIQQLAKNLAIYVRNGVPLSSGQPQIQAQIRDWIGGAIRTILARSGQQNNANAVGELDTVLRRVLTSETATPASTLDAEIARLNRTQLSAPLPATPLTPLTPNAPLAQRGPAYRPIAYQPPYQPPVPVPAPQQQDVISYLRDLAARHPYLQLTGCIALAAAGQEGLAVGCLEELAIQQVSQGAREILNGASRYIRSLIGRQPTPQPQFPPLSPQPLPIEPAPLLDTKTPCPSCDRIGQQLDRQEAQLKQEIQTEQNQDIESRLAQQEAQLTQFAQLETQPASQRNIQQELQQKQQLQTQIEQERYQLQNPGSQSGYQLPAGSEPAPQLQQSQSQQIEQQIEKDLHDNTENQALTFCMGCKSQEDAIMFLNGEPSACSVMPGTTKYIQQGVN